MQNFFEKRHSCATGAQDAVTIHAAIFPGVTIKRTDCAIQKNIDENKMALTKAKIAWIIFGAIFLAVGLLGFAFPVWYTIDGKKTKTETSNELPSSSEGAYSFKEKRWERHFSSAKDIDFVQIGSNCGTDECAVCGEPVWKDATAHGWRGTVVEPNPVVFEKLQQNYSKFNNVQAFNLAVATESKPMTLYVTKEERYSELSTLSKERFNELSNKYEMIEVEVEGMTLNEFWGKKVKPWHTKVDILNLDAEGYDYKILLSTNLSELKPLPTCILYENHWHGVDKRELEQHVSKHGFLKTSAWEGCNVPAQDTLACRR